MDYIPVCRADMEARGWDELDILFVSGDAYIDHPAFGVPLLARFLEKEGFRVGILAQPDWRDPESFKVMGRPRLFAAVSAGAMDSMVNHYTAAKKIRRNDAYTPGGLSGSRPNRAVIAYTAAVKGAFKALPVVIGGIEASLRRLAHYDYWADAVRRSILVDAKADICVFGMGESPLLEIARRADAGEALSAMTDVRGTACLLKERPAEGLLLPSFEEVAADPIAYNEAFRLAALEANPLSGRRLCQSHGARWVSVQPPSLPLKQEEMDRIYALPFRKKPHPSYDEAIPAFEQIRFSVTTHRGCFGGCAFCAITHHQGKTIQSRSEGSVLAEVDRLTEHPEFRGTISDVGGPTANMYGLSCGHPDGGKSCRRPGCLYPKICRHLEKSGRRAAGLLRQVRKRRGVRHSFVASGIRYDLLEHQQEYFEDLLRHHVGGLLKVAPESTSETVTAVMHKPGPKLFESFLQNFRQKSRSLGLPQSVVPYFISSHPGCTLSDMVDVALFLKRHKLKVEQVQAFTPTPGTLSTCIYYTGRDPDSGDLVHVPRTEKEKRLQKALLLHHLPENRKDVLEALRLCGREEDEKELLSRGGQGGERPVGRSGSGRPGSGRPGSGRPGSGRPGSGRPGPRRKR